MSFFKRVEGVFFGPTPVFRALAEKPVWVDALVILLLLLAVFSAVVAPYSQSDQLKMFKDNTKLKERMGETRYTEMIAKLESASAVERRHEGSRPGHRHGGHRTALLRASSCSSSGDSYPPRGTMSASWPPSSTPASSTSSSATPCARSS